MRQRVKVKGDPEDSDLLTWREQPVTGKAIVKGSPGAGRVGRGESLGLELKASSDWRWTRGVVVCKLGDLRVSEA